MQSKTIHEQLVELGRQPVVREVPGLSPMPDGEVRYVEHREQPFKGQFKRLVRFVDPPLMKEGAAVIDGCVLTLPDGRRFQAIYYRGDIDGWRQQVAQGARALKVTIGELVDGVLMLDDGSSYTLADCKVEFD